MTPDQARKLSNDWYYKHAAFAPADDGSIVIGIPNASRERILPLVRWLGPGAEILEPVELRQELVGELNGMAAAHGGTG
ncbi:WYL domain-containing protein [uncultured Roseibium sp.]|uniref:WYL domain-containing protein n=1 Tax=uncultured Roseibium sp. TaxID=1936171 RepID=UPI00321809DD